MTDDPHLTARLATLGAFFAGDVHDEHARPTPPWRPMRELLDDPAVLAHRVDAVRAALDDPDGPHRVELRVAASVAQLGLVARVLAPVVGAAALGHERLPFGLDDVWWQARLGGPFPASFRTPRTAGAGSVGDLGGSIVEAITVTVARRYHVSAQVVWGNVASAANTAARLAGATPGRARPGRARPRPPRAPGPLRTPCSRTLGSPPVRCDPAPASGARAAV